MTPHFSPRYPYLFSIFSILSILLEAAPQKRNCHSSTLSFDQVTTSEPTSDSEIQVIPTSGPDSVPDSDSIFDSVSPTASLVPDTTGTDTNHEVFTTLTTVFPLAAGTLTPTLVLVYSNTTIFPSTTNTTRLTGPHTTKPSSSFTTTTTTTAPSLTTRVNTYTTPNMGAMQTAYYENVCSWEVHQEDAICLGDNTMMCCRADNERCRSVLEDGGLSCQGIQSGDWATTWARPTVTVGGGGGQGTATASGIVAGSRWKKGRR